MESIPAGLNWVKSSHSLKDWDWKCLAWATLPNGGIAIHDSKNPAAGMLTVPRANAMAFIHAAPEMDA